MIFGGTPVGSPRGVEGVVGEAVSLLTETTGGTQDHQASIGVWMQPDREAMETLSVPELQRHVLLAERHVSLAERQVLLAERHVLIGNQMLAARINVSDVGRERSGNIGTERNNLGNFPTEVPADDQTQLNFGSPRGVDDNGTENLLNEPAAGTEDHQASISGENYGLVIQPDLSTMSSSGRASLERIGSNAERQVSIGIHLLAAMDNMTAVARVGSGNVETELNLSGNAPPEVLADEQTQLNLGRPRGVNESAGVTEDHQVSTAGEFYERLTPPDLDSWSIQDLQRLVSHTNQLLTARINMSDVRGEGSGYFGTGRPMLAGTPTGMPADDQTPVDFGTPRGVNEPAAGTEDHQASISGENCGLVIQPDLSRMSPLGRASFERVG